MGKITDFGKLRNEQEPALAVERTESFYSTARELSDFIAALPISREENDRLIALIIQQVQGGEQGAFAQGLRIGKEFAGWNKNEKKDPLKSDKLRSGFILIWKRVQPPDHSQERRQPLRGYQAGAWLSCSPAGQ